MNIFIKYASKGFWDERANPIANQNINYSDKINQYLIDRKVWIIEQMITKFKPKSVLDAGCGAGGVILPLAKKFRNIQFCGVDFSRENIREMLRTDGGNLVIYDEVDISERIRYGENNFDLLYSFDVLCHLKYDKLHKVINEFHRVAKKQYYVFDAIEYTVLPRYHFMFSKLKLPTKITDDLTLKYTKKAEENKMPEMRGLMYEL